MPDKEKIRFAWETEIFRITAFSPIGNEFRFPAFQSLTRRVPEQSMNQPQGSYEAGSFHTGRLFLTRAPGRADLLLNSMVGGDRPRTGFYSLGSLDDAVAALSPLLAKLWPAGSRVRRIAVGIVSLSPVPDAIAGVRAVTEHLPFISDFPKDADAFGMELNRPVQMKKTIHPIKLGRVLKLAVVKVQELMISAAPGNISSQQGAWTFAVRSEIDINTDDDNTAALPTPKLKLMIAEMTAIAVEMAREAKFP